MSTQTLNTDLELLRLVSAGDPEAFTILFHKYKSPLFDYAIKITKTETSAEELVQDTFLKLWLYRDKLPEVDNATGYIHSMVRNAALDWLRKLSLDRKLQMTVAATLPGGQNYTLEDIQLGETQRIIREAMDRLSPQQREVFWLSRYEGLSYTEIAEKMGLSGNTVRNHLVKALKYIREYLGREYGATVVLVIMNFLDRH